MPPVTISIAQLMPFGDAWNANGKKLSRSPPFSSNNLGGVFERAVAASLATMLGGIPVVPPTSSTELIPPQPDCVEVGEIRTVGGVRPQNFDVVYRPDGIRFAFDAKTLNDLASVRKNWQNMINDLATEATTIHSRFPYAVVAFLVAIPEPALLTAQRDPMIETLERLARRVDVNDPIYLAEAISLVVWDPSNGSTSAEVPGLRSSLSLDNFSTQVESAYVLRYKGLPPHAG